MKNKLFVVLMFFAFFSSTKAIHAQNFWKNIKNNNANIQEDQIYEKKNFPSKFSLVSFNLEEFKAILNTQSKSNQHLIKLPNSKGSFSNFAIKETSNFETKLSERFPTIKSYSAQGIDDPTSVAKISIGTDGFHAVVFSAKEKTLYIDPYSKDNKTLIVYNRSSLAPNKDDFTCLVDDFSNSSFTRSNSIENADDGKLRTFRLALACSGEYAQFHLTNQGVSSAATDAVKKAAVLSAMNTTMTRVNGVYEKDLGVKMIIVDDNEKVIFLDANTDNITDGTAGTMINEVQAICDAEIGNANYDIGHVFSIGGDGLAGLGVVCVTGQKARGVTGRTQPIGDAYDIDYVAHEMGHQFGANHTQNNSCNRNNDTAVEPGSASTIMGYAGICAPNVQSNSDDHFHSVSITEMWNTIQSTANCGVLSDTNNTAPTASAGADFNIPKSTPFVLRGKATDVDGVSSLTYNWEQIDNEIATMPPASTSTVGPLFRSIPSKNSPDRYMPDLATVVAGSTSSTWEVVPSVAREMNFSFLVRDNNAGGGSSARDDVKITVADADAFTVASPNTAVTWDVGTSQTITWNKGTTDVAPINSQIVNIKLSIDGGVTFPITLKENTPNDGTENFVVPNNVTTTARIMVEAADNIFYNVNATNFTINSTEPTFFISNSNGLQTVCNSSGISANYNFNLEYVNGYTEPITLSATGNPSGTQVVFNPTIVTSASGTSTTFTMTINNLQNVAVDEYTINVKGTSTSITKNLDVQLKVYSSTFTTINLTAPVNVATNVFFNPLLSWQANVNASSYIVEVSNDNNFTNKIVDKVVTTNSYNVGVNLNPDTVYYWRVKGKNLCGESAYSSTYSFTTQSCSPCDSSGAISDQTSTTLVSFNTINNVSAKPSGYSDYKTIITEVQRGESHQLTINVNTDGLKRTQTKVWIDWNQNCDFNDAGEEYDLGSVEDDSNGETSLSPLVIAVPNNATFGNTVMRVSTINTNPFAVTYPSSCENGTAGEVEDYTVLVKDPTASVEDISFKKFNLYPNPTKGEFKLNFELVNINDYVLVQLFDVRGRLIDEKKYSNTKDALFSKNIVFEKTSSGLYLIKVTNGNVQVTRKFIIE
ncbi:MAG: reprolysin-like metallopeptidase [Flavobacteriaceae bacterium]